MGHPGDDSFDSLIDDAEKNGIIVTSQNATLPKLEAKYAANGFGYVGAENYTPPVTRWAPKPSSALA